MNSTKACGKGEIMKYRINQNNYHTFEIFEVNKLAPRSYFIPYPDKAQADAVEPGQKLTRER